MLDLHPQFLSKNGQKEFAVLPHQEFLALQELLTDLENIIDIRAAKQQKGDTPSASLAEVKKRLILP